MYTFYVLPNNQSIPKQGLYQVFLWEDNWNDWFEYQTLYSLVVFDGQGVEHFAGGVKIGQFGWQNKKYRPELPAEFQ